MKEVDIDSISQVRIDDGETVGDDVGRKSVEIIATDQQIGGDFNYFVGGWMGGTSGA